MIMTWETVKDGVGHSLITVLQLSVFPWALSVEPTSRTTAIEQSDINVKMSSLRNGFESENILFKFSVPYDLFNNFLMYWTRALNHSVYIPGPFLLYHALNHQYILISYWIIIILINVCFSVYQSGSQES